MKRQKIGIIGSGISGLTCAHKLATGHEITVYESEDYIGGHTHTVSVEKEGETADIDTGFIVFNDRTYPNFRELMDSLGVAYQPTEMSFSVKNDNIDLEYNGNTLNTLFAQRKNLLSPRFYRMISDILRFNRDVRAAAKKDGETTIGDFLTANKYSELFTENYLLPMISAIWSMGLESCMAFPLQFFVRFFDNHGLLNIINRPQWYTINGGSSSYIAPLTEQFKDSIRVSCPVVRVERQNGKVTIVTPTDSTVFDQVIFSCHGDQALALLNRPTALEEAVLREFRTSSNRVVLHTDTSFLPQRRLAWASWNYNMIDAARELTTLTYNMNILQRLSKKNTYLVTLNQEIPEQHILGTFQYNHPVYSLSAIDAQRQWQQISGRNNTHYCGAYWFNGFHEDGVKSALRVCAELEGSS